MKNKLDVFNNFRNNVMCRREHNQHKAKILWEIVEKHIPENEVISFKSDWNHYLIGHDSPDCFAISIFHLKKYFE